MVWVRTDDQAPSHPKQIRAGAEACWLWQCSLCYSNAHQLNGRIDKDLVPALYAPLAGKAHKLALRLVDVGLWHDEGDHYEIHDYADYQGEALKESVEAKRAYERDRKREQRSRKSVSKRSAGPDDCPEDIPPGVPDDVPAGHGAGLPAGYHGPARARSRPGPARPGPEEQQQHRVNGHHSATEADSRAVFRSWHAAQQRAGHVSLHGFAQWRADYDAIAVGCQLDAHGVDEHAAVARHAVCAWFWLAPNGPVQSQRIAARRATPAVLAKRISADLEAAKAWWFDLADDDRDALLTLLTTPLNTAGDEATQ